MSEYNEYGQNRNQQARRRIQENLGASGSIISSSGLRRVLEEYGDDLDEWMPRVTGVVFGGLAASGAAAGTFGVAAVAGGAAGYAVGHKFGSVVTSRVKDFIYKTLQEAEDADSGMD